MSCYTYIVCLVISSHLSRIFNLTAYVFGAIVTSNCPSVVIVCNLKLIAGLCMETIVRDATY
jgi:fatty acid-binding protein DegV